MTSWFGGDLIETSGGWGVWINTMIIVFIGIGIVDYFVFYKLLGLKSGTGGGSRWFAIHSICNVVISIFSIPDFMFVFFDPVNAIKSNKICSIYPLAIDEAMHIYHMVVYHRHMTRSDWIHHIAMSCIAVPFIFVQSGTPMINATHVFITGIPGAIDYALLSGVKEGMVKSLTEKEINNVLNIWVRSPGILFTTFIGYCHGHYRLSQGSFSFYQFCLLMLNLILNYWNALYFMERVVASYHVNKHKISDVKKEKNTKYVCAKCGDENEQSICTQDEQSICTQSDGEIKSDVHDKEIKSDVHDKEIKFDKNKREIVHLDDESSDWTDSDE